ncbi:hypothetical protein SAMN04488034_101730 [Salinimicrobium catena]|uniref:DUF2007 domain-containing protein n=1 Tax=Salinimicrobium catena TaxID=390640 RepID=A0A1H5JJ32_9FLAO|nr:hypothetical protein [Salinimicrobium catena]SDK87530.1 hypothetical protein SAMN04488140_101729 [Salinimicrobium catena]SEE51658.1 hypothetical protein SAMN04488034_101730 [Salinimicrobium catena]
MEYTTIWETRKQNQLFLLRNIFEQNNIDYRFLDEKNTSGLVVRVQVVRGQEEKAGALLRENGLLKDPSPGAERVTPTKFWIWLFVALFIIIVAAVIINWWMR